MNERMEDMQSTRRRKQIMEVIRNQGGISVGEIAERFGVSKMTGHRDLEQLEQRGLIKRIFGGAVPLTERPATTGAGNTGPEAAEQPLCTVCRRPPASNLIYTLHLVGGEQRIACCPHCGISVQLVLREQVEKVVCVDYLSGRSCLAEDAYFLMASAAAPCCQPSLLTFDDIEVARRFQSGFGGSLGRMSDAVDYLQQAMSAGGGCPHCGTGANG